MLNCIINFCSDSSTQMDSFRLCGPAFTVRLVDSKLPDAPPKLAGGVHYMDLVEDGSVIVIESPPCEYLSTATNHPSHPRRCYACD